MHSVAVLRVVADRLGPVGLAAGHSLGEFTAWVAAGTMAFADTVRTVRRLRGELMQRSGDARPGTMAAVLGLAEPALEEFCRAASGPGSICVLANYNSPGQLVISGDVTAVERAMELARADGARRVVRLNVSGAFHSPLMEVAQAGLQAQLEGLTLASPRFPVVSNVTAEAVTDVAPRVSCWSVSSPPPCAGPLPCVPHGWQPGTQRFVELGPGSVRDGPAQAHRARGDRRSAYRRPRRTSTPWHRADTQA